MALVVQYLLIWYRATAFRFSKLLLEGFLEPLFISNSRRFIDFQEELVATLLSWRIPKTSPSQLKTILAQVSIL